MYFERANQQSRELFEKKEEETFKIGDELKNLENYVDQFFDNPDYNYKQPRNFTNEPYKLELDLPEEELKEPNTAEIQAMGNEDDAKTAIDLSSLGNLETLYGKGFGKRVGAFGRHARINIDHDNPLADEAYKVKEPLSSRVMTDDSMRETNEDPFSTTYQNIKFKNNNNNENNNAPVMKDDEIQEGLFM